MGGTARRSAHYGPTIPPNRNRPVRRPDIPRNGDNHRDGARPVIGRAAHPAAPTQPTCVAQRRTPTHRREHVRKDRTTDTRQYATVGTMRHLELHHLMGARPTPCRSGKPRTLAGKRHIADVTARRSAQHPKRTSSSPTPQSQTTDTKQYAPVDATRPPARAGASKVISTCSRRPGRLRRPGPSGAAPAPSRLRCGAGAPFARERAPRPTARRHYLPHARTPAPHNALPRATGR